MRTMHMNFSRILVPLASLALLGLAWRAWGGAGIAVAGGGLVMWLLLHFTRMMTILKRAAGSPIGHVGSAVMLNAKLRRGVPLLHVMALTRALGALQSPEGAQPEIFRWTDGSGSHVTCTFRHGRLAAWTLVRPETAPSSSGETPPAT